MKSFIKKLQFIPAMLTVAALYIGCNKGPEINSYIYPVPEPTGMFPDTGYAGFADITITGSSFGDYKNVVKVFFNGIEADTILSCEDGKIVARVPKNAISGKIGLQVWNHTLDSIGQFRIIPIPVVLTANKDIGLPGETVTITGKGFGTDVTQVKVDFNGTTGAISDITDTTLNVTLPEGFTSGNIMVTVNKYPIIGPGFRAFATVPNPVYWLAFEDDLNDKMGGTAATYTYSATDGTAKPIGYDAGMVGKAVKLAGTGNRGTLNGQVTNNQYIACPPQISKHPEVTVTAWVNWGSRDYPDSVWYQEPIFDFGQARGMRMALMTRMQTSVGPNMVGRLIFEKVNEFTAFKAFDAVTTKPLLQRDWHHVAMTISTANLVEKVYLDGVEIGSLALTGTASPTLFNHNKVYIGGPTNGVRNEPAFGGLIDEFKIFNQALSADQIYAIYYKNKLK
jgi:hypothetical protein